MGQLVFQATLGGQVNLVGPNTASTYNINVPTVSGNMVTTGDTGTVTNTMLAGSIANNKLSNSSVTIGSTNVALGATSTTLAGLTGVTSSAITDSGLTSGRVTYATTGGLLTDSANMTFNGTTFTLANDASISGLTVGKGAGSVSTNVALGDSALAANTTGSANTALGSGALAANSSANNNTAVGRAALTNVTSGVSNIGIGYFAGALTTTGGSNIAIGQQALYSNTTASANTAVGYQAGYANTTGNYNTFLGYQSGYNSNVSGNAFNTCIGLQSGYSLSSGTANTFIGVNSSGNGSGSAVTSGSKNTILGGYTGNQGGLDIRTSNGYIVLSDGDGNPRMWANGAGWYMPSGGSLWLNNAGAGLTGGGVNIRQSSNSGRIDIYNDSGTTTGVEYFYYGGVEKGSITVSSTATAYNTSSDYRLKTVVGSVSGHGERIDALEPVEFVWNSDGTHARGFLAHKFQEVYPSSVTGEKDAMDADGKPVYQAMQASTSEVIADLVAEIKSLRARVAQLEAKGA